MTHVEFRAKVLEGSAGVTSFVIDAVNEADARRQIALRNLSVISLEPVRRLGRLWQGPQLPLAVFSQQLVSLLDAGLSLVEALEALAQKESNSSTQRILERILLRLYEGQTLATAIAEHPGTFPDLYVAAVRASEKSGALREALTRYIAYQQQADALRKTLVNACIYPAVLLVAGLLVTLFLMGYVVPRFSSIYEDVGTDLPFASRLLLQWGQLIDAHVGLVVAGAVAALRMSAGVVRASSRAAYAAATRAVTEGQSLGEAMERHGLTTPVAARMLRVGERSGNMGEMMERIADFCDEELARWVAVVTRLIEPVLMIVIGLIIGVIVVLMYFPIFQLAGSIR